MKLSKMLKYVWRKCKMKEFNALVVREENENITYKIEDNITSKQLNGLMSNI